ncbi:hypothetical protein GALMADRAFT_73678 [Galerina marginata CBS 339.88]|uniref:Uncharacterized protein n=1 Tax=Galerina marginata (strain CBS 339.88) TaxID=685588 RepID=A0A067SNS0_GALM3|nr:hypothetical protein GALMADRAFT_73678 [Galerina marginata CBS 339.88]
MPGPGSRGKGKSKGNKPKNSTASSSRATASTTDVDEVYVTEIDHAEAWGIVVNILCNIFELPDLTSRSGLKKVHTNFSVIYEKIAKVYQRHPENVKIRGGIVGIFAKMCVDSLLRDKLMDKGILDMIMPLLDVDETRHLALRALSTITRHGGSKTRIEIAKRAHVLTNLIRNLPDDEKVAELGVTTLAHSVMAVVEGDAKPANPSVLKSIDMVDIFKTVLEAVKRPYTRPRSIIDHAVELVSISTLHASSSFKSYTPAVNFLVAGLRSKDWVTRCTCLGGLIRLYRFEAEEDQRHLDPQRFIAAIQRGVPNHLGDIMMDYGTMRCDIYLTLKCSGEFQKAMMACAQNHDLYALGLKQAELILKTEFSIADGMFEVEDPVTRKRSFDNLGLPFKSWSESLPHCAKAIRKMNKRSEEDFADILEIKYFIMKQRIPDAVSFAKKAIQRNPEQAYFFYAITLSADNVQGLRAAKKGLKCKMITPFVMYQMMQRAVQHAGDMGVKLLQDMPEAGEQKWEEGIAFLMSALDDAKAYVEGAPPDNRHMKNVGYWYVLLTMLINEDLSPDLRELSVSATGRILPFLFFKAGLERLKLADQFSQFIGVPPPKTNLRLAQQSAVKHFSGATKEFSRVFETLDKEKGKGTLVPDQSKLDDDLSAWLEDMKLEDGTFEETVGCRAASGRAKVNTDRITLYRCSWCGNPSAVLRKC